MSTVLVTGGRGRLGSAVVRRLLDGGHDVRVASRHAAPENAALPYGWARVDYRSGKGLDVALTGVDTVVHCASGMRAAVDTSVIAPAVRAGGPHVVYISIVGVDRVPMSYYRNKLAAEHALESSHLPYTILRATQFHDLVRIMLAALARLPVMTLPRVSFQPIDVGDVAGRLAELAAGPPAGRVPDIAGPEVRPLAELAVEYLRAVGRRRPTVSFTMPGKAFAGYRTGGHLAPDRATSGRVFAEYLAEHPNPWGLRYWPKHR